MSHQEGGSRKGRALKPEASARVVPGETLPSLGSVCKNDVIIAVPLTGAAMRRNVDVLGVWGPHPTASGTEPGLSKHAFLLLPQRQGALA